MKYMYMCTCTIMYIYKIYFRTADVDGPVKAASAASVGANPKSPHPPLMTRRTTVMLSEIAEWSTADIKKWVKESGLEK